MNEQNRMRYILLIAVAIALLPASASAEFVVWASDRAPNENPVPGMINLFFTNPNHVDTFYLYGAGSPQLSAISLDLILEGNAIKFTSATVNNPGGRWSFLDGPLTVTDKRITNIGGAAIPPAAPALVGQCLTRFPASVSI